ncbi:hypothetical protein ACRALDRAFT_2052503 [Sodiomyces alcalophilus JCM 7366]|uniref:uncharacterized protein n=1 Tax=Sodiomyces alcalophilus JCM 7366 TaxID=591952 RepID=UPI0039B46BF5
MPTNAGNASIFKTLSPFQLASQLDEGVDLLPYISDGDHPARSRPTQLPRPGRPQDLRRRPLPHRRPHRHQRRAPSRPLLQDWHSSASALDLDQSCDPDMLNGSTIRLDDHFGCQFWFIHIIGQVAILDIW